MLKLALFVLAAVSCLAGTPNSAPHAAQADESADRDYWLHRKADFYHNTAFDLSDFNLALLGRTRTIFEDRSTRPVGHLPFWFDYELFKTVFKKPTPADPSEELRRHHAYINACLRAIKQRVLFRMLAGTKDTLIEEDADRFFWEKAAHLKDAAAAQPTPAADEISFAANIEFESDELPLERAIRLMKAEMGQVESKNQVETYLRAFNEIDGSAINGQLPY